MKNHHHHKPAKPLGLIVATGDATSSLDVLLGIPEVRRLELEAHIQRAALDTPNSTFLTILLSIEEGATTTNELVYCAYFFGTIKPYEYHNVGIESSMERDFIE